MLPPQVELPGRGARPRAMLLLWPAVVWGAELEYLCGGMFETPVVLSGFRVSYDSRFERLPAWTRCFEAAHAWRGWLVSIIRMRGLILGLIRALQGLNSDLALTFTATWRRGS